MPPSFPSNANAAVSVSLGTSMVTFWIGSQTCVPASFSASINTSGVRLRKSPAVLDMLEQRGVAIDGLSTRHATLEDVFVHLTGRQLREGDAA